MKKRNKVCVVGLNHAGTTALKALAYNMKKADKNLEIVAYDRNDNISFLGCGIALWVGHEFEDPQGLFYATPEKLRSLGVTIKMKHEMIKLDAEHNKIWIRDMVTNEVLEDDYDKLILAIGSWPVIAPGGREIPGLCVLDANGNKIPDPITGYKLTEGVVFSKLYQHAQSIKKNNQDQNCQNVVVCGGGYIGCELVEAFNKDGKNVTLIDFETRIMPRYYDLEFTEQLQNKMVERGVKLQLGERVERLVVNNGKVTAVITDKGEYQADLVIMAIGFLPNTEVLKNPDGTSQIALDHRGAIKVNEYFCTSKENIYAIGDCVNVYSNAWKKDVNIALATNAVRSGLVAALNVVNENKVQFPGVQGTNAIAVFNWKFAATGLSETSAALVFGADKIAAVYLEDQVLPPFMQKNHFVKIKVVFEKQSGRIIGAQIGSEHDHTEAIFLFSVAIMKNMTVAELPLIDLYFLPHFNKPYNYITRVGLQALDVLRQEDTSYPDLRKTTS